MDYKDITEADIRSWVKNNRSTTNDVPYMILEQLANGDTTIEEFREWVLECKATSSSV